MISVISGKHGRAVSVRKLFMSRLLHTCRVLPWPTVPRSDTNMWTINVAQYSSSIFSFITSEEYSRENGLSVSP